MVQVLKKSKKCLPNEHLNHEEINFLAFSPGNHHLQQFGLLEDTWILNLSNSSHVVIFFNLNRLLQVFSSNNPLVNLSCPFQIFNLDSSFHSFF